MTIQQYLNLTTKQKRSLAKKAERNASVREEYLTLADNIITTVNKNIADLTNQGFDYGNVYNRILNYTASEYDSFFLKRPNQLDNDLFEINRELEQATVFLNSNWRDVSHAKEVETYRINRLIEMEVLPENFDYNKSKEFLRWLGNEEFSAAVDNGAKSELIVEIAWDMYKKKGSKGLDIVKRGLQEFNSKFIGFDKAMSRVGVNIENYTNL